MARGKFAFKQTDVTRALRAVAAAGVAISAVRIDTQGNIEIVTGKLQVQSSLEDDLDRELVEFETRRGQA